MKSMAAVGVSAALILTSIGIGVGVVAHADTITVQATTAVNIRSGPSTDGTRLGLLYPGQTITATGPSQDGWTPVTFNGKAAWISSQYLAATAPASAPATTGTATATTAVNVRSKATTLSTVLGLLAKGQTIGVTGPSSGGWTPVSYNGTAAYISSQYLTTSTPAAPATTTVYTTTAVNVRSAPAMTASIVAVAANGASIQATSTTNGDWTQVIWGGSACWMSTIYLSKTAPSAGPATPPPAQGAPTPTTTASAQDIAHQMLQAQGLGDDQFTCLVNLWNRESGWRVDAQNSSSGAYGIPQAYPGSKMASAGADWQTNPATQITWGLGYIKGRYGDPCGAWTFFQANYWY